MRYDLKNINWYDFVNKTSSPPNLVDQEWLTPEGISIKRKFD